MEKNTKYNKVRYLQQKPLDPVCLCMKGKKKDV